MSNIDLTLNIKDFEKLKSKAKEEANERYHGDEPNQSYSFADCDLELSEEEVDGNVLKVSGSIITPDGESLGFINLETQLDFEKLIEIFQSYIKKLNKVKTVMESVKDE